MSIEVAACDCTANRLLLLKEVNLVAIYTDISKKVNGFKANDFN